MQGHEDGTTGGHPGGPVDDAPLRVVGIGGSAGALQALSPLLEAVDANAPIAIVVVLHLAPDYHSEAAEILQRATSLTVTQVTKRTRLCRGHVYVIAPGMNLITDDGHVQPAAAETRRPSTVIDLFLRTLGQVHKERSVGIILSGTGRDGSLGIAQIREWGGVTIAQTSEDCEHADMPRAAIATGAVDLVLSASEIGQRLNVLAATANPSVPAPAGSQGALVESAADDDSPERALQDILTALRRHTRYDFRHYKRGTIMRRLERRMHVAGLPSVEAYRDYALKNPEELTALMADMLISVTNFFRDPSAFDALQRDVIPQLMEGAGQGRELRVWIAACASGEESYSVAMLLHEYADRMAHPPALQLFASDISDSALQVARAGLYPANIAVDVPEQRLLGFFEREDGDCFRIRPALRETVVFARHNALTDPPFSRLDLICCRNLLIYLDRTAQAALLETFAYALKPGGYLFLGNAESVDALSGAFEPVDKEHRIYRLQSHDNIRLRIPAQIGSAASDAPPLALQLPREPRRLEEPLTVMHERAILESSAPTVLINAAFDIERVSQGANRFVAFGEGLPSRNLLNNVAPDIRLELRSALYQSTASGSPVTTVFHRHDSNGKSTGPLLDLSIYPVKGGGDSQVYWLVRFTELEANGRSFPDAEPSEGAGHNTAVEQLEHENRALKESLQETLDRSAVSEEELKSSNEELQSINEELRSAKEELETSREELQSVNEELTTVNFELRMKVEESGRNNDDLRNLIDATEIATVFVDSTMCLKRFTPQASKLFSLIPSDIGRPFVDVKTRLQYDEILEDAMAVFKSLRPFERTISTSDDQHFLARLLPYRTGHDKIGGVVFTFIDVTELQAARNQTRLTEERMRDAIASSKDFAVISTDTAGKITGWNDGAARIFGYAHAEIVGRSIDLLYTEEDCRAGVPQGERSEADRNGRAADERWHLRRDGTTFFCSGVLTPLHAGGLVGFLKIARDASQSKDFEIQQRADLSNEQRASAAVRHTSELKDRFLATMSHELKQPLNLIHVNVELLMRLPAAAESTMVRKIGQTVMRAVAAQEKIVNDLLDLSRVQTGKMHLQRQATDIGEIVAQLTQALVADTVEKGVQLEVTAAPSLLCECDPVRFEQILWNLMGNAMKFTAQGGRIDVRLATEDRWAKLEVADTGAGISKDFLPRIFELFAQDTGTPLPGTKRSGLGIGLALVKELVEAHDGRIEAASGGTGMGSTFTVWLPLATMEEPEHAVEVQPEVLSCHILMVDDDADSLEVFSEVLQLEGASVDTAGSGQDALAMLAANEYDLVLSDIGMPVMSGLEFMQKAREKWPDKKFKSVAITGFGASEDAQAAILAGFNAHISKPVSVERLQAVLQELRDR